MTISDYYPHDGTFYSTEANDLGYKYHFANLGEDWTSIEGLADEDNFCGIEGSQSPVSLLMPIGSYGWAYGLPLPIANDAMVKSYKNIKTDTQVKFDYSSVKVKLEDTNTMSFESEYARSVFEATTNKFIPTHFVFKSPSEHTINGLHHDVEMQLFHRAEEYDDESSVKYAAVSIMFSVEKFDEIDET
jgi:hypothetical protein